MSMGLSVDVFEPATLVINVFLKINRGRFDVVDDDCQYITWFHASVSQLERRNMLDEVFINE